MKQIYFLLAVLFLAASCSFGQQDRSLPGQAYTRSEDILKAIIESHNHHSAIDSERTVVTTRVLENGYVLESRMGQYWDGSNWVNASMELYTYNTQGLKTEEIDQMWNNGQWENSRRFLTTYNSNDIVTRLEEMTWTGSDWEDSYEYVSVYGNDKLTEYDVQQWNGAAWDSLYKNTYAYTTTGNLETEVDLSWNGAGWDNQYRYTYQYNANDDASQKLEEQWMSGEWKNSILNLYTYNGQNQLELDASFWWPDTAWKESVDLIYAYDGTGNINDMLTKFWESDSLGLQNHFHNTYEYIPGTAILTKAENQEWNLQTSEWTNTYRDIYTYDGENIIQNHTTEVWGGSDGLPGSQDEYTYDGNGNLDVILAQYWDGSQWVNSFKQTHTWTLITSIEGSNTSAFPLSYSLEQNYPNPFNPATTIRYSVPKDGNVKLTVYNVIGQKIAEPVNREVKAGTYEVSFDASQLTSGVYLYKMETEGYTIVRKMMLLK